MNLFMAIICNKSIQYGGLKKVFAFLCSGWGNCINLGLTASSKEEEDKASGQVPSGSGRSRSRSREEEDRPQQSLEARGRVC